MKITFMITCKEATKLLSDQLDGPIGLGRIILLKTHVFMCEGCNYFGKQIKGLKEVFTKKSNEPLFTKKVEIVLSEEKKKAFQEIIMKELS